MRESTKFENLKRGEFGVVEAKNGYVLDKRQDPANGLTYYVIHDKKRTRMWSDEEKPWDFRRAVRIFNDLGSGGMPVGAKEEKFDFM